MPLVGLQCVIVVFPDHTHLLFAISIHCSRNTGIPISGRSLVCHVLNVGLVWRNNTSFFVSNPYEI